MDGNRRWARENGYQALVKGHQAGMEAADRVINFCLKSNIKILTLYAFSIENFNRSDSEKEYLFDLIADASDKNINKYTQKGISVRFVGDRTLFPESTIENIKKIEQKTADQTKLQLNILFCYGAQQELVSATRLIAQKVKEGLLEIDDINEANLRDSLWLTGRSDPDLILRTGGTARLSNFLLYQAAYSELQFLDCYWPEVTEQHLTECINKFNMTKRNFGH